jgi:hypothetical protein
MSATSGGGIFQLPVGAGNGGTPDNTWNTWSMNTGAGPGEGTGNQSNNIIDNGNGTYTDTSTGMMYSSGGQELGIDPSLQSAYDQSQTPDDSGGGGGGGLSDLLKALGGVPGIAGILGPLLGGIYANHATSQATSQVLGGIQNANEQIKSILGGQSMYSPYMNAGNQALQNASNTQWKPLNFGPLGQTPVGPARITNTNPITSLGALAGRR